MKKILIILTSLFLALVVVFTSCKKDTAVTGVELNETAGRLALGDTEQLVATVLPQNATNKGITWSSTNADIVHVDQNGLVTAIGLGTATVTVTTADGNRTATRDYIVARGIAFVTDVIISLEGDTFEIDEHRTITVTHGDIFRLSVEVFPQDTDSTTTDRRVRWGTGDPSIVTADGSSTGCDVYTLHPGEVLIWAVALDRSIVGDTIKLVINSIPVEGMEVFPKTVEMAVRSTRELSAGFTPNNASNQTVNWVSRNEDVVTVSANGQIRGISEGETYIVVTAADHTLGTFTDSVFVSVSGIAVEGMHFRDTNRCGTDNCEIELFVGGTYRFIATITPSDATYREIIWTSSDTTIAFFERSQSHRDTMENTVRTFNKTGTATITATTVDGGFVAVARIRVVADGMPQECDDDLLFSGLGTITWGGNASPETGRYTVGDQVWSLPVMASECNKTTYYASTINSITDASRSGFMSDCRTGSSGTVGVGTTFLSWCAVMKYREQICPYPWRVPTHEDWKKFDIFFDGDGETQRFQGSCQANDDKCEGPRITAAEIYGVIQRMTKEWGVNFVGGVWGINTANPAENVIENGHGFRNAPPERIQPAYFWHLEERNATMGGLYQIEWNQTTETNEGVTSTYNTGRVRVQSYFGGGKHAAHRVRCVRDK